jgi:hypothetical protein
MRTSLFAGKTRALILPVALLLALAACDSSAPSRAQSANGAHNIVVAQNDPGEDEEPGNDSDTDTAQGCPPSGYTPNNPAPTLYVSHGAAGGGHFGSLNCALQAALGFSHANVQRVAILIAPGTYRGEKIRLQLQPNMPQIAIGPQNTNAPRPVFEGTGNGAWMHIEGGFGTRTPFSISGIEIRDYKTALTLNASSVPGAPWIGGITITNSRFDNIGAFSPDVNPSTAVIRLVNARYNDFENNQFSNIRNMTRCGGLHVFYIAHFSSQNVVRGNSFDNGCGSTIKVRDQSDNNQIVGNTFSHQEGPTLFLDNFCNPQRARCTGDHQECPSENNVFSGNTYLMDAGENPPRATQARFPRTVPGCESVSSEAAARIQESGTRFVPHG